MLIPSRFLSVVALLASFASPSLRAADLPKSISDVRAPIRVGTPPSDSIAGLVRLESGEIRFYDYGDQVDVNMHHYPDRLPRNYLSSQDNGLTWELKPVPPGHFGADARSPVSGEYLRLIAKDDGVHLIKSKGGVDGQWFERNIWETPVRAPDFNNTRPAVFIRGGRRVLVPFTDFRRFKPEYLDQAGTLYSDDDGETWSRSNMLAAPAHEPNERDKSVRWQNLAYEPTVAELRDGRVWMIFRTSTDYHYESFSEDGGATWSAPRPSPFYGTCTTPTIGRLKDGRLLFVWNNTTPLPEFPKNEFTAPYLGPANTGQGEDMFTNRDAVHAAISDDDGRTWHGFRELYLNVRRNDGNYAETWGIDRSVHQPQFVEVDQGRVLVSVGQHWLHRSLVLFDPAWLSETERRSDFANGLDDWSVQGYLAGIRGHCALNRLPSATLVSDPNQPSRQVLEVRRMERRNLLLPQSGATWNFPAGHAGTVETRLRLNKGFGGARIALLDRWLNPTDPTAHTLAMCHLDIAADGTTNAGTKIEVGNWHTLKFQWKASEQGSMCAVFLDDQPGGVLLSFQRPANHGVSYIHYQTNADAADKGFLIGSVSAKVQP